ncbi:hypothetical protein AVEN_49327-1 [Araneus ventricosus]|uniref:Uncharacterized protein n=1 Tax=Araneus ventricosus TaxID=182803 RepID=A0A4Y2X3J6_ARAVE|nr:hypothetical protein AVEN_49327-1 [Araneus ventricosus]
MNGATYGVNTDSTMPYEGCKLLYTLVTPFAACVDAIQSLSGNFLIYAFRDYHSHVITKSTLRVLTGWLTGLPVELGSFHVCWAVDVLVLVEPRQVCHMQ